MSLDALQAALAGEHAAVYAYGAAAARLPASERARAVTLLDGHRDARDALAARVRAAGTAPVGPSPGYALPLPLRDAAGARRLLALVESRLADLYGDAIEDGAARPADAAALAGCAERAASWSGRSEAWPGFLDPPG